LEGFKPRSGGEVRVLGEDPEVAGAGWRGRIGVVLQESSVEQELTVREVVELYAGYHAHPLPVDEALRLAGLTDLADRRGARLSARATTRRRASRSPRRRASRRATSPGSGGRRPTGGWRR